jgi:hypothetical protein
MDLQKIIKISLILLIIMCLFAIKKDTIENMRIAEFGVLNNRWKGKQVISDSNIKEEAKKLYPGNEPGDVLVTKAQLDNYKLTQNENYLLVDERFGKYAIGSINRSDFLPDDASKDPSKRINQDLVKALYVPVLLPNVTCTGEGDNETCVLNEPTTIKLRYFDKPVNLKEPIPEHDGYYFKGGYCSYVFNCDAEDVRVDGKDGSFGKCN